MKKSPKQKSKKVSLKKILLLILSIIIGIIFIFLVFVRLSPGHNTNIPWGHRQIQIHVDRGIRVFFPKDDTTYYYFNNFDPMQIITGTSTLFEGFEPKAGEYIYPANTPNSKSYTTPKSSDQTNISNSTKTPIPTSPKLITSKNLNLTFTVPTNVRSEYSTLFDGNIEHINFYPDKGYRMSILVGKKDNDENCKNSDSSSFPDSLVTPSKVTLANKIELVFQSDDMDGRKGWFKTSAQRYFEDKQICLNIYREINGEVEKTFDQILETAKFN